MGGIAMCSEASATTKAYGHEITCRNNQTPAVKPTVDEMTAAKNVVVK